MFRFAKILVPLDGSAFAEMSGVDLIVLSSHGLTGVKRWAYGSVAEKVLHGGPCAVLVVRC